jgi:hypothetical protein
MVVENGYTVKGALIRSNESMKGKKEMEFFGIKEIIEISEKEGFGERNNRLVVFVC